MLCNFAQAQNSHFSQYDHSPLTTNPALTAIDKNYQIVAHHKEQWRSLKGYRTDELSFEFRFDPTNWIKIKNRTALYKNANVEDTIRRSKAVGEPPLLLAFSVFFAIRDAIASVADYRVNPALNAPATGESIMRAVAAVRGKSGQNEQGHPTGA